MSKIIKVNNGDFIVDVTTGGKISLNADSVNITGEFTLQGTSTSVNTVDLNIQDNLIQLNQGNTGAGISSALGYIAGFQIARGTYDDAQFVFDDSAAGAAGTFTLRTINDAGTATALADLSLNELKFVSLSGPANGNITFNLNSVNTALVSLSNADATTYATNVSNGTDNSIPNRKYITSYVAATNGMADVDNIHTSTAKILAGTSVLTASIDGTSIATITSTGINVNTVSPLSGTELEINASLILDNKTAPTSAANKTKIYSSATIGPGNSGLYFVNTTNTDEIVAKNRALLFSMLF